MASLGFYSGWIIAVFFFILSLKLQESVKIAENKHTPENEALLKEKLEKEIILLNKKINYDFPKGNIEIKTARIPLGNLVRAYKSQYVYLKQIDLTTFQISDGMGSKTTLRADIVTKTE